jgi:hypothetical protein
MQDLRHRSVERAYGGVLAAMPPPVLRRRPRLLKWSEFHWVGDEKGWAQETSAVPGRHRPRSEPLDLGSRDRSTDIRPRVTT